MGREVTLNLDADTDRKLSGLADALGYSREMAAVYAVRLLSACLREGLLDAYPARAWPEEAQPLTGGSARVLEMPRKKSAAQSDQGA